MNSGRVGQAQPGLGISGVSEGFGIGGREQQQQRSMRRAQPTHAERRSRQPRTTVRSAQARLLTARTARRLTSQPGDPGVAGGCGSNSSGAPRPSSNRENSASSASSRRDFCPTTNYSEYTGRSALSTRHRFSRDKLCRKDVCPAMSVTSVPMTLITPVPPAVTQVTVAAGDSGGTTVDPYSKDAINQLFRRQPQRFKFVSKFNAKSVSWKDFELVYLDNRLKDFARCVHCKSFVTYSSKKGTGGMLRHRCVGKDGPVQGETAAKKISLAPKPLTIVTTPRTPGQRSAGQLCTLLNLQSHPGQPGNIQTIIYNPDQSNVLNLQNLTKLGLAVQAVKAGTTATATATTVSGTTSLAAPTTTVSITKIEPKPEVKQEVNSMIKAENTCIKEVSIKEEQATVDEVTDEISDGANNNNNEDDVEQIVSNVELNEDVSYGAPSCDSEDEDGCQADTRNSDYGLISAPAEVQLADLQVKHEIEQHNARMEVYRRQLEVADLQKEFWKTKLKTLHKSSKASEDDGIHSDD
ncbi:hypothetical protein BIW11_00197 [Tropilaelaps mercedesae]|uniref:BED-type domain-containing protein n=1 Tax=Tropilaelaps mercedesae TaxID=418985 RepID=A0A1V9Y065_9ACAR|nr:hypothetical protein BIW11_00197 [Tropilaelaps mercedesae]